MPAPLLIGLAAGALGFFLGNLGKNKKKEEPAKPPKPDPRIDQIQQTQQRHGLLLRQLLMGQQQLLAGQRQGRGPIVFNDIDIGNTNIGIFQNPAALSAMFPVGQSPAVFQKQLNQVMANMPPPRAVC